MNHGHGGGNATAGPMCEMTMLWNWQTVNVCFLAETWHVKNGGMFAASCVGTVFLALSYEALRRLCREYDMVVMRQLGELGMQRDDGPSTGPWFIASYNHGPRRATAFQQLVRTIMHVMAAGVGYIIMLVLMSFNGYTFFCVLIGTGIGKFFCDWVTVGGGDGYKRCPDQQDGSGGDEKGVASASSTSHGAHAGCDH